MKLRSALIAADRFREHRKQTFANLEQIYMMCTDMRITQSCSCEV